MSALILMTLYFGILMAVLAEMEADGAVLAEMEADGATPIEKGIMWGMFTTW